MGEESETLRMLSSCQRHPEGRCVLPPSLIPFPSSLYVIALSRLPSGLDLIGQIALDLVRVEGPEHPRSSGSSLTV